MNNLDAGLIRHFVNDSRHERLAHVRVFSEIDSTNSYLMQMPGPDAGKVNVAATTNQTAGRGRHGKTWQSPPGSGVCLSAAYTFRSQPENLPALTLALGLAAVEALEELGAGNLKLKWPNDLVALDGKLGGILTEVQQQSARGVTVVTGIGINIDMPGDRSIGAGSNWASEVVDLGQVCDVVPTYDEVAGAVIRHIMQMFADFEAKGFSEIAARWSSYDWLQGREITVDTVADQISGIGAGVADDGAYLVETADSGIRRIASGVIVVADKRGGTT